MYMYNEYKDRVGGKCVIRKWKTKGKMKEMIQFQQPFEYIYMYAHPNTHTFTRIEKARFGGKFKPDLWRLMHWGLRAFIWNFDAMDKFKSISVQRKHGFDSVQNEMADGRLVLRRWSTQFGRGNEMKVKNGVSPPFLNLTSRTHTHKNS